MYIYYDIANNNFKTQNKSLQKRTKSLLCYVFMDSTVFIKSIYHCKVKITNLGSQFYIL